MNACASSRTCWTAYVVGGLGLLCVMAIVVNIAVRQTANNSFAAGEKRAQERRKNITELHQANAESLNSYAVIDATKGIVRLPIDQAISVMVQEWQSPVQGRKKLVARIEKATAVAPKPPETPSVYE